MKEVKGYICFFVMIRSKFEWNNMNFFIFFNRRYLYPKSSYLINLEVVQFPSKANVNISGWCEYMCLCLSKKLNKLQNKKVSNLYKQHVSYWEIFSILVVSTYIIPCNFITLLLVSKWVVRLAYEWGSLIYFFHTIT